MDEALELFKMATDELRKHFKVIDDKPRWFEIEYGMDIRGRKDRIYFAVREHNGTPYLFMGFYKHNLDGMGRATGHHEVFMGKDHSENKELVELAVKAIFDNAKYCNSITPVIRYVRNIMKTTP